MVAHFAHELGLRNKDKLTIKRGKMFDYLGSDIDFESYPGALINYLHMIKYLSAMIEE